MPGVLAKRLDPDWIGLHCAFLIYSTFRRPQLLTPMAVMAPIEAIGTAPRGVTIRFTLLLHGATATTDRRCVCRLAFYRAGDFRVTMMNPIPSHENRRLFLSKGSSLVLAKTDMCGSRFANGGGTMLAAK